MKKERAKWTCEPCGKTMDARGRMGHLRGREHAQHVPSMRSPERKPMSRVQDVDSYIAGFTEGFQKAREIA